MDGGERGAAGAFNDGDVHSGLVRLGLVCLFDSDWPDLVGFIGSARIGREGPGLSQAMAWAGWVGDGPSHRYSLAWIGSVRIVSLERLG